jgi:hypothetical protein
MKTEYYISSGRKNGYYTLRVVTTVAGHYGPVTTDGYVRRLTRDLETSIEIARREYVGNGALRIAVGELDPIGRSSDYSYFHSGKYEGERVVDVPRAYLLWLGANAPADKSYLWALDSVAGLRDEVAAAAAAKAAAAAAHEAAKGGKVERRQWIISILRSGGDFANELAVTLAAGRDLYGRGVDIAADIVGRAHGRRGSAKYEKAYVDAWDELSAQ